MATGHVRDYVKRVASIDQEQYPRWDLTKPLPQLPVPDLQSTLNKYLAVIRPITSQQQYARTRQLAQAFCSSSGPGPKLQEKLRAYAETCDNWAYDWWLDDMYMRNKLPLPINSNPGMIFPSQQFLETKDQLRYATRLISGILDYKTVIDTKGLPVDRARHREKGQPLCMEQYYRLFTSYRVPGKEKDHLTSTPPSSDKTEDPDHVIVICKNQFFALQVMLNGSRLSEDDLFTQLNRIHTKAEEGVEEGAEQMVGILTSDYRDKWATARETLMQDATNRLSLEAIERCIFVLCLDDAIPISFNHQKSIDETTANQRDEVSRLFQMLHGFGTRRNGSNRWYDKTMQFIISADGAVGLNYEHSPSEGIAVVQLIEHLLTYVEELRAMRLRRMQSMCDIPEPRKLEWNISDDVQQMISEASSRLDGQIEDLDLYVLRFHEFGRNFPKSQNMSPDSFIQLALQLTFYKVHGKLVSTYESASTRRFRKGRVDNIRANSSQALEWVQAMVGEVNVTDAEKMQLLRKAMGWQTEIMLQTILGHGIDCHLLGLRQVALQEGMAIPELFTDEVFRMSNHFSLSTSQVNTTMDDCIMCYGPVVPDGYGVCYNPHPDNIVVCVASFKSNVSTSSDYFASTLESSFLQMYELCLKANETPVVTCTRANSIERRKHGANEKHVQNGDSQSNAGLTSSHNHVTGGGGSQFQGVTRHENIELTRTNYVNDGESSQTENGKFEVDGEGKDECSRKSKLVRQKSSDETRQF